MNEVLLTLRKEKKAKKPTFMIQDSHKRKRIRKRWGKPQGWQSKMRLNRRGYNKMVSVGYKSPKAVRGLSPAGLEMINVHSLQELSTINTETQGIIIGSAVGKKKKLALLIKAKEAGITVINFKDVEAYIKSVEEEMAGKKATKTKKKEEKKVKEKKEKDEIKKKEDELTKKLTEEEKKEEEKKEKDKLLIKKTK